MTQTLWSLLFTKNNFHQAQIECCIKTAGTKLFNFLFSRYGPMWPVRWVRGRWWFFKHFSTKFRALWKGLSLIIKPEMAIRLVPIFWKFLRFCKFSRISAVNAKIRQIWRILYRCGTKSSQGREYEWQICRSSQNEATTIYFSEL